MSLVRGMSDLIPRSTLDAVIRQAIEQHGGYRKAAQVFGIGRSTLEQTYNGHRDPGERLLRALGYRKVIVYERIKKGEHIA